MNIEHALEGLHTPAPGRTGDAVALGAGLRPGFSVYEAPVGDVAVLFNPRGVSAVRLVDELPPDAIEARAPSAWSRHIPRALDEGRPGELPLDLSSVTPFRRSVLTVTGSIPKGEVRSYGWLARHVGKPGAARAVGSAMATNPVPLIVPCHRVVRSDGHIGAYSLGGAENKWALLRHEGADPEHLELLASEGVRYVGSDTTNVFCVPTCRAARRISPPHLVEFGTSDAATEAGYRPCRACRPLG